MNKKSIKGRVAVCRLFSALALILTVAITGCKTQQTAEQPAPAQATTHTESIILREGDVLRITFQGNPNLDTTQPIRRDGNIALSMVGEVKAVGLTPADLEKKLVELYKSQLVGSPEITVAIQTSAFPVFISGAVLRPGKIMCDRPMTVFEAIMEAGGPDYSRAKLTAVTVIRFEEGQYKKYTVNVKRLLENKDKDANPFYLKSSDVVRVPEKFSWF